MVFQNMIFRGRNADLQEMREIYVFCFKTASLS